jgi:hypothetical protein
VGGGLAAAPEESSFPLPPHAHSRSVRPCLPPWTVVPCRLHPCSAVRRSAPFSAASLRRCLLAAPATCARRLPKSPAILLLASTAPRGRPASTAAHRHGSTTHQASTASRVHDSQRIHLLLGFLLGCSCSDSCSSARILPTAVGTCCSRGFSPHRIPIYPTGMGTGKISPRERGRGRGTGNFDFGGYGYGYGEQSPAGSSPIDIPRGCRLLDGLVVSPSSSPLRFWRSRGCDCEGFAPTTPEQQRRC